MGEVDVDEDSPFQWVLGHSERYGESEWWVEGDFPDEGYNWPAEHEGLDMTPSLEDDSCWANDGWRQEDDTWLGHGGGGMANVGLGASNSDWQ